MKPLPAISLRALEPEDLDLLYRIENDDALWGVGITNVPYSRFLLHEFLSSSTGDIYTDKQVRLVIENEAHQTVGLADLMSFDPKNMKAELGLVILRACRHQGYAAATILKIHDYARRTLHLHQIYVVIAVSNDNTLRLFQQMGYQQSARLADWLFDGEHYHDAIVMQHVL
jgi:diamine N-acetyltransferase